jgi:hypothetical protein
VDGELMHAATVTVQQIDTEGVDPVGKRHAGVQPPKPLAATQTSNSRKCHDASH